MIDIEKKINSSNHVIVFKDVNRSTKYASENSLFFYQGISKIKNVHDLDGMTIEKFASYNKNLSQEFVQQQVKEENTVLTNKTKIDQDNLSMMLANNKLVVFNRWYETAIDNGNIIGFFANAQVKQLTLFELYTEYLSYFPDNNTKGRDVFCKRFNLYNKFPNSKLSDSFIRDILFHAMTASNQQNRNKVSQQTRRNIKYQINAELKEQGMSLTDLFSTIFTVWKDNHILEYNHDSNPTHSII